ncbi:hypothetical protein [Streptomyces sp. 142MFCol3.1]|nr:hypothetical protein [Streptomyces sp. 142MFCol3.1]
MLFRRLAYPVAADGEPWPAGIDPAELAATEQRAYSLLARLYRHRY